MTPTVGVRRDAHPWVSPTIGVRNAGRCLSCPRLADAGPAPRQRNTTRYTSAVGDEYRWPDSGSADLRDGLTTKDVVEALYAPTTLRMDNRRPAVAPTFMAVCAPACDQRLIVVVCLRGQANEPWTITGARDASANERAMWRKHTS